MSLPSAGPDADRPLLIAVVGPTAVGKTAAAVALAHRFQTVVLSADSRQFYRELAIGTAKPTPADMRGIPHYFIDSHPVEDNLSAGDFEREGLALLDRLFMQHRVVVLVGGSGLFVDALCRGLDDLPEPMPGVREKWNKAFAEHGIEFLATELARVDPLYYASVDRQNPQRIIRALEVFESTGIPFSQHRQGKRSTRGFETCWIGLDLPRAELYARINQRVDSMMEQGLVDEVRTLLAKRALPALKTVGYAELFDYLDGLTSLEQAVDKIKQHTRRYAKRQLTWFRKNPEINWFHPKAIDEITEHIEAQLNPSS